MTEWVNESWAYDASPAAAFRMLTRLDHLTEQAAYLGYTGFAVRELRERDGFFRVSAERQMPELRRGPASRVTVRHTQQWHQPGWDGARRFDAVAHFGSSALAVTGQGQLQAAANGSSRYSMRVTIRSGARFFARQIERDVADALSAVLAGEHLFRERWLAARDTDAFRLSA